MSNFAALVKQATEQDFSGWDFSWLQNRWKQQQVSWNFRELVEKSLQNCNSLLDMGTGGGEFLASLKPLPANTVATENWQPNVAIAKNNLPSISIISGFEDENIPLRSNSFQLITNRHESFNAQEIVRLLQPGGCFLTQQVGGQDNLELNKKIQSNQQGSYANWNLLTACQQLERSGLTVELQKEKFPVTEFYDIGAVVYYLKAVPWQIPDFSVAKYRKELEKIHKQMEQEGKFAVTSHRFLIKAKLLI